MLSFMTRIQRLFFSIIGSAIILWLGGWKYYETTPDNIEFNQEVIALKYKPNTVIHGKFIANPTEIAYLYEYEEEKFVGIITTKDNTFAYASMLIAILIISSNFGILVF